VPKKTISKTTDRSLGEVSFRDREAAIAALVGQVLHAGWEANHSDYPALLPCELRLLLRFWIKVAIDLDYYRFLTGNVDGSDTQCRDLAWGGIEEIQRILGQEEVESTLAEVREQQGQYEDPRYWNVFWDGTPEEKEITQEEARRLEYGRANREVA